MLVIYCRQQEGYKKKTHPSSGRIKGLKNVGNATCCLGRIGIAFHPADSHQAGME